MIISEKLEGLSSAIFSQLEAVRLKMLSEGRDVFNFSIGTPDLPPAPHIMKVLSESSLDPLNYRYAIQDLPELKAAVKEWYIKRFKCELDDDEILSLAGSQEGLSHIALALINPMDTVLVPDPGYPIFTVGPLLACAKIEKMPLSRQNKYLVDFDTIAPSVAHDAKMMIVSYPGNPVTAVAPPEFYEKLIWFAKKYDIAVIHDNAYCELVFDGRKGYSFLEFKGAKEVGIELNSLSKSYNIPGARISFALGNKDIVNALRVLKSHTDYGIFLPVQRAAIAALNGSDECVRDTCKIYESRRDIIVSEFGKAGWRFERPEATMFIWAKIPERFKSSVEFTFWLLENTGVIVVPGSSFGSHGEGYVRIAMVQNEEVIRSAAQAIKKVMQK